MPHSGGGQAYPPYGVCADRRRRVTRRTPWHGGCGLRPQDYTVMNIRDRLGTAVRAHRRLFVVVVAALSVVTWTAVGASAWFLRDIVTGLPEDGDVREIGAMAQATTLLDVHGRPAFTIFKEQRIEVPLERVSPHVIKAIIAVEDQRFFDHGGLDVIRVAGAALTNFREGRAVQGGSTLTQQLARQSFLTTEKTYRRKLKELIVATRIESQFDKRQILELYLNKVYFGDGLYGVEAASLGYFGKHAADLDLSEAALLAGLVKSPSAYAPTVDLDRAIARRKVVLQAMRDAGVIDAATYEQVVEAPVILNDTLRNEEPYGRYFKEEVRKALIDEFGRERVYQGGLKVYTTLDLDLQKVAESEVMRGLDEIEKRQLRRRGRQEVPASNEPLQAALVALDPHSGEVRAMVGGRDFDESPFNRVTQAHRQPGSAFKPFIYAAALERGFSPGTVLTGLNDPVWTPQGDWVPDDGHSTASSMTMRAALRSSSNRAAVRMLQEVGIPPTVQYAKRLGVGSVPSVPSLALGSGEVTLMSMASAYAVFANEGMLPTPVLIRRVETTDGEVLFSGGAAPQRVVSEATAFLMSDMLADVVSAGTAAGVRRVGFTQRAAGKTGTTNDYKDAWFIGYTPKLVTGVWVGYDMPRTIIANGYAAELAVPIWGRFMKAAIGSEKNDKTEWFKAPKTVTSATICRLSGRLANEECRWATVVDRDGNVTTGSMVYTEHFVRGTEPSSYCPIHGRYESYEYRASARDSRDPSVASSGGTGEPRSAGESATAAAVVPPVATSGTLPAARPASSAEQPPTATPAERRGFWSRIFRRPDQPAPQSPAAGATTP
jgi:1A family penicillin-binding protein